MKKIILFSSIYILGILAARAQSCCMSASTTVCFASFSKEAAFRASHDEPLPLIGFEAKGTMITMDCPDGQKANAYLLKAKKKSKKWLFVYQEWWGLNDYIKRQAEAFYGDLKDVNVLAIDMYDGNVATKREDAAKLMQAAKDERLNAIIKGAINYVGKKSKIASVGWCFGGGLSLKSALAEGKQAVGCVMYYGMPTKEVAQLKTLNCDVLGLFAQKEKWISPQVVAEFEQNMQKANKQITTKLYDAEHAFANPSNPNYDKIASDDAYQLAINYLRKRL